MKKLVIISICLFLGACSGGGGGDSGGGQLQSLGGLYGGSTVNAGVNGTALALISETGNLRLIDHTNRYLYSGQLQSNGQSFSGQVKGFAVDGRTFCNGLSSLDFVFNGAGQSRASLDGTLTASCGAQTISLDYDRAKYEIASSLPAIAGTYSVSAQGFSETLVISSTGQLTQSSQSAGQNCSGSGTTTLIDTRFNMYKIDLTITCNNGTFGYSGLASIFPATASEPVVLAAFFGNFNEAVYRPYIKQN